MNSLSKRLLPRLGAAVLALLGGCGPSEPDSFQASTMGNGEAATLESLLTSAQKRSRCDIIKGATASRGITNPVVYAGVANHETGLAQCWSEATWACQGPNSSDCGGGPVIAGSGDGACSLQQGGLGMYQFDNGTYSQTLSLYGSGILTVSGNASKGVDVILDKMKSCPNTRDFIKTDADAIAYLNKARPGTSEFETFLTTMAWCYNGCSPTACSAHNERREDYRQGVSELLSLFGDAYWYSSSSNKDLYAVVRSATGTHTTEVHVLSRSSTYQSFWYETGTALQETGTDGSWAFRMADYNNDGRLDLWAISKQAASGRTEVHVLDGASNFNTFLLHSATTLGPTGTDQRWVFLVGDYNADGRPDLYAIDKNGTASGKTEVHVLDGANNFQTYLLHAVSGSGFLGNDNSQMLDLADYDRDGRLDLWVIAKSGTGSGTTELHVLGASSNFATYILHSTTGLGPTGTDGRWMFSVADYNDDGRPDLYAINKNGTGSGKTEVHVLDGANGFQPYLLHSPSALGLLGNDFRWTFDL